jgi:hypothetical protein
MTKRKLFAAFAFAVTGCMPGTYHGAQNTATGNDAAPVTPRQGTRPSSESAPAPQPKAAAPAAPSAPCPDGMALVQGNYCPDLTETCVKWKDEKEAKKLGVAPHQCAEFAEPTQCNTPEDQRKPVNVCMDVYEYSSDKEKHLPDVMVSFYEAQKICSDEGKRLCTDTELIQACRGPEDKPYPTGYLRDDKTCHIDRPWIPFNEDKINHGDPAELKKVDQRVPVGTFNQCVSDYGVHDITGSVDEWGVNETRGGKPYISDLHGGYWGPVRDRCTPLTTEHGPGFKFYQVGFRCCEDPAAETNTAPAKPVQAPAPR